MDLIPRADKDNPNIGLSQNGIIGSRSSKRDDRPKGRKVVAGFLPGEQFLHKAQAGNPISASVLTAGTVVGIVALINPTWTVTMHRGLDGPIFGRTAKWDN